MKFQEVIEVTTTISSPKPKAVQIVRTGGIATVIATIINAIIFATGVTFTFPADAVTALGGPVNLLAVAISTLLIGVMATLGYLTLTRFFSVGVARIVMWVSLAWMLIVPPANPFGIGIVPVAGIVILEVMHIVAARLPAWRMTR
jgi:CBS domain containing-hemolysin-like protein